MKGDGFNYLYVMKTDKEYYKIGVTNNPDVNVRLRQIRTANPTKVEVIFFEERPNAQKAERFLHKEFDKNRVQGEWFKGITLRDIRVKLMLFFNQD